MGVMRKKQPLTLLDENNVTTDSAECDEKEVPEKSPRSKKARKRYPRLKQKDGHDKKMSRRATLQKILMNSVKRHRAKSRTDYTSKSSRYHESDNTNLYQVSLKNNKSEESLNNGKLEKTFGNHQDTKNVTVNHMTNYPADVHCRFQSENTKTLSNDPNKSNQNEILEILPPTHRTPEYQKMKKAKQDRLDEGDNIQYETYEIFPPTHEKSDYQKRKRVQQEPFDQDEDVINETYEMPLPTHKTPEYKKRKKIKQGRFCQDGDIHNAKFTQTFLTTDYHKKKFGQDRVKKTKLKMRIQQENSETNQVYDLLSVDLLLPDTGSRKRLITGQSGDAFLTHSSREKGLVSRPLILRRISLSGNLNMNNQTPDRNVTRPRNVDNARVQCSRILCSNSECSDFSTEMSFEECNPVENEVGYCSANTDVRGKGEEESVLNSTLAFEEEDIDDIAIKNGRETVPAKLSSRVLEILKPRKCSISNKA